MVVEDVDDLLDAASVEGIGTESQDARTEDRGIDLRLVLREPVPVLLLQPERIAGDPESFESPGQCAFQLCGPGLENTIRLETAPAEVPFLMGQDLDLPLAQPGGEVGDGLSKGLLRLCRA